MAQSFNFTLQVTAPLYKSMSFFNMVQFLSKISKAILAQKLVGLAGKRYNKPMT
ncbi:hypothetical protein FD50_GL002431 [Liquorilactobacillus satsumensis DSM 16230 = JCM 12392]|uniref:Uncharacterized protein n=1 Tax=Liquorilactobacillus satsumensis DSM 16230 = JCM 12392 TaxID=1423801 RepID=A0A0R1V2R6_9LACO|nr:hypothetical protein FD50_GL002431 [Liquorilactobacillus satsumensis DSM 16230 = JCM 12392]